MKLNSFVKQTTVTTKQVRILKRSTELGTPGSVLNFATKCVTLAKSFSLSSPQFFIHKISGEVNGNPR